jgi:LuxR family transcriptional regulator, glucitol operon activator
MSFSATRLTCFALLSALEEDLRAEIELHVPLDDINGILGQERAALVEGRRARDHGDRPARSVASLLPYVDFSDSFEILNRHRSLLPVPLADQLASVAERLQRVTAVRNRVAHTRPMEIDDLPNVLDLVHELVAVPGNSWGHVRETLARLDRDPAFVLGLTISLPMDPDKAPQNNLPVPDFDETGFFGRRAQVNRIKKAIKGAYPVVSILGDGGIGKTSIALKVAYELLDDPAQTFDAFVWVTAKATVLTSNEIQRIGDAIQDSLGLFATAARELGGEAQADPVSEVLSYLEHFKILLILDNLETVLDERLREFLLDLPVGSKVIVTSRIGMGIENPVRLEPLTQDESTNLLRSLARIRQVSALTGLSQDAVGRLASSMGGHPAYIKWFVAGVQAGRRPEELLTDNALLLDFCMSNVFEFLDEDARAVLRSMQVLPGPRNQPELAFINDFTATRIQAALLGLITTNFVQMQSRSQAQMFETTYELTDFGRQYLDKRHAVTSDERVWLLDRNRQLHDLGAALQAENTASPYDPGTVDIRGAGDFHVAKLLRDAIREAARGSSDVALENCREAQYLAPTYHEAWRVEAYVHEYRSDYGSAYLSYERALELAPDSDVLAYFFGSFLVKRYGDPGLGLTYLQRAAQADPPHPSVVSEIAATQLALGDWGAAVAIATYAMTLRPLYQKEASDALLAGVRAAVYGSRDLVTQRVDAALELIESSVVLAETAPLELVEGEAIDRILQLKDFAQELASSAPEEYMARKASEFTGRLQERLRRVDVELLDRRISRVKTILWDKFYGFATLDRKDYFFHLRDFTNEADWDRLTVGAELAILPVPNHAKGRRAASPRLVD